MNQIDKNRELIIDLLKSTKREGIDDVIGFLCTSDFFTAPASTRFHSCHEGGLAEHSLNVYKALCNKLDVQTLYGEYKQDTLIIAALLHDICKANFYKVEMRNTKQNGVWVQVPYYTVDDKSPLGHGEKSVMILQSYIKLTKDELYAIRWHMGFSEVKENYNSVGAAFKQYPLALALHEADLEATYLLEENE
nr:HD domain-containing protein [uncultured Cellulosilyticum sp.]